MTADTDQNPSKKKLGRRSGASLEVVVGATAALAFFAGFGGWAATARLDAAVHAGGSVVVAGNRQAVQHREGGVISRLYAREGDAVTKGQVLIELSGGDVRAREETLAQQIMTLEANRARLQAEMVGSAALVRPASFAALEGDRIAQADVLMQAQTRELAARRQATTAQKVILNQRAAQLRQQIVGYEGQIAAKSRQRDLIQAELEGIRSLNEKGFASGTRLRALEREVAAIDGSASEYKASIARAQEAVGETRLQSFALDEQILAKVAEELRQTELRLAELTPQWTAATSAVERLLLRAPSDGLVQGMTVFTEGGVAKPGETLLEIVPQNRELLIEALVRPEDADDIHPGQRTEIRVLAFSQRSMPLLDGEVRSISADRFIDPRSGQGFFKAQVAVPTSALDLIAKNTPDDAGLRPGLPVEVIVPLRKRTALEYLWEPLQMTIWRSFREH